MTAEPALFELRYELYSEDEALIDNSGPQLLVADSSGIRLESSRAELKIEWHALQAVNDDERGVHLEVKGFGRYLVPAAAFGDGDARARFAAWIRSQAVWSAFRSAHVQGDRPTSVRRWPGLATNLLAGLRSALFLRVTPADFCPTPGQLLTLALIGLALQFGSEFVTAGAGAVLNFLALPRALLWLPLAMLAAFVIARGQSRQDLLLLIPVIVASTSLPYDLMAYALSWVDKRGWLETQWWREWAWWVWEGLFALWALAVAVATMRVSGARLARGAATVAAIGVILALPLWWIPYEPFWTAPRGEESAERAADRFAVSTEDAFYGQPALLERALSTLEPQRTGVVDLYFVGVAGDASQDVFMKELRVVGALFRTRFDAGERSVLLVNNPSTVNELPVASATSLGRTLHELARVMDAEEDVLLLYLTSHGSADHHLAMEFWPLKLNAITPGMLRGMLDDAGIKWRVIVISACYSGGFIDALKGDHTLVVTASDARHASFGCGSESEFTYFGKAYFDDALRTTYSFTAAFEQARKAILERERSEGLPPSSPQMFAGARIEEKLAGLVQRLSRTNGAGATSTSLGSGPESQTCVGCEQ